MFTPPPSPLPPQESSPDQPAPAVSPEASHNAVLKRKRTSRLRWSILAVPAVLVLITLTTRYISHPVLFDSISGFLHEPHDSAEFDDWGLHKRHPSPQRGTVLHAARANNNPSSVTTVPTIPVNPPLPTPFPQPFDTTLSKNFSTQACIDFYTNMTLSLQFRQCRPFGLLAQYSSQFIDAQTNVTLLNNMVWGTCNTVLDGDTCFRNMDWFATSLKTQCTTELTQRNPFVVNTLNALGLYTISRNAGCQSNPATNAYCYIQAATLSDPSDLYFYQVQFGLRIPNNTRPSCSSCTKSLMSLYVSAISGQEGIKDDTVRSMLAQAYAHAARIATGVCGDGFVQNIAVDGSGSPGLSLSLSSLWFASLIGYISVVIF
ncbi:hypothetical protein BDM02DRAFT_2541166 [Thelephora ganbajun]|uniref:Uncharacterized protein n=1 Tax=Thelephora ganbajun TaxID=370292 RepID=A0ACB6ZT69_THEGA|nr:hypothetical protein BDM02DRAFT_2541166 [Thelephora ganbajun]